MSETAEHLQLVAQTVLYYCIILFGLLISIPVGVTQMNFGGECILYADVIERKIEFGAASKCTFVTYLHVVLSVLYATLLAGLYSVMTFKRFKDTELKLMKSPVVNIVIMGVNACVSFVCLIAACVISVGFSRWCDSLIINAKVFYGYNLQSLKCSQFQEADWANVDGSSFHECYSLAIAASWLVTFAWVSQTGFNALTFLKGHKRHNCPGSPASNGSGSSHSGAPIVTIEKY